MARAAVVAVGRSGGVRAANQMTTTAGKALIRDAWSGAPSTWGLGGLKAVLSAWPPQIAILLGQHDDVCAYSTAMSTHRIAPAR